MATKIERIDREITKTREKIAEYQEKLKTLEAQKTEAENLEIVQLKINFCLYHYRPQLKADIPILIPGAANTELI